MSPFLYGLCLLLGTQLLIVGNDASPFRFVRGVNSTADASSSEEDLEDALDDLVGLLQHMQNSKLGILAVADTNRDDKLSYKEIYDIAKTPSSSEEIPDSAEILNEFKMADKNGDGFITPDEIPEDDSDENPFSSSNSTSAN